MSEWQTPSEWLSSLLPYFRRYKNETCCVHVKSFSRVAVVAQLRIALAQVNPIVGGLEGNCDSVVAHARQASDSGDHLAVFPEMVVTGYSVEDLALWDGFVSASTKATHNLAERLAEGGLGHLPVVVRG